MSRIAVAISTLGVALGAALLPATSALAAAAPAWSVAVSQSSPASSVSLQQGDGLQGGYDLGSVASWPNIDTVTTNITNSGSAASSGTVTATLTFSSGVSLADLLNSWSTSTANTTQGSNQVTGLATTSAGYPYAAGEALSGTGIPAAVGTGSISSGSNQVTNVVTSSGSFVVGASIAGDPGIPSGTTIVSNTPAAATATVSNTTSITGVSVTGGHFAVGDTVTGTGIASSTTISACPGTTTCTAGTWTLSKATTNSTATSETITGSESTIVLSQNATNNVTTAELVTVSTITAVSGSSPNIVLTLSNNATATSSSPVTLTLLPGAGTTTSGSPTVVATGGPYEVGNAISATGIPSGATITQVNGSTTPTPVYSATGVTLTLSANATANSTAIALTEAATRVTPTGSGWTCSNAAAPVCTTSSTAAAGGALSPIVSPVQVTATAGAATQGGSVGAHIDFNPAVTGGGAASVSPVFGLPIVGIPNLTSVDMPNGPFRQGDAADSYTINVTNNGLGTTNTSNPNPNTGTGNNPIVVTESTVPPGETPTAMYGPGWNCSVAATTAGVGGALYTLPADSCWRTDAWPWGSILPSIQFVVSIASNAAGSQQLSTKVSGGDTEGGSATVNTPTTVAQSADVITDSVHIGNFNQGDAEDFYYVYTRNVVGPNSTTGGPTYGPVVVTETAPPGETITGMTGPGWSCSLLPATIISPPTVPFPDFETPADSCVRSDPLAVNTNYPNIQVAVAVADDAQPSIANQVTVSGGSMTAASAAGGGQSFSDTTTVNPEPDLTVYSLQAVGSATQPSVIFTQGDGAGAGDSFLITGYNYGFAPTSGTITITATLPPDFALASTSPPATGNGWSCTTGATDQIVTCTTSATAFVGSALPSITVPVTVSALAGTEPIVDVSISGGGEIDPANDLTDDTALVRQLPDLTIYNTDSGNGKFHTGDVGDTFTLTAADVSTAATNGSTVTVTDTLPSGLTATAIAGNGWTCSAPTGNPGGTFTCTTSGVLNPSTNGAAFYPPITLTVNVNGSPSSPQVNVASVAGGGEVYTADDTASDSVVIAAPGSQPSTTGTSQGGGAGGQSPAQTSDTSGSDGAGSTGSGSSDPGPAAQSPAPASGGSGAAPPAPVTPATTPVQPRSMTSPPVASKPLSPSRLTALVHKLGSHRYTVSGRLSLPAGVSTAAGCKGNVTVTFQRGRTAVASKTAVVSSSCTYRVSATLSNASRLAIISSFHGNSVLLPYVARV